MPSRHLGTFAISHEVSVSCVTFVSEFKIFQGPSEIIKFSDFTIRHKYSLYVAAILATRFLNSFLALNQIFENYMYKHNQ